MRNIIKELGKNIKDKITGKSGKIIRTSVLAGATLLGATVVAGDSTVYYYKSSANNFEDYIINGYKAAVGAPTPAPGDFIAFVVDARDGTGLNSSDNATIKLEKVPGDPEKVYVSLPSDIPNPSLVNAYESNIEFGPVSGKTIKDDYLVSTTPTMGGPLSDSNPGVPSGSFNPQIPIGLSRATPIIKKNNYDVQKRSRGTPNNVYTSRRMKR